MSFGFVFFLSSAFLLTEKEVFGMGPYSLWGRITTWDNLHIMDPGRRTVSTWHTIKNGKAQVKRSWKGSETREAENIRRGNYGARKKEEKKGVSFTHYFPQKKRKGKKEKAPKRKATDEFNRTTNGKKADTQSSFFDPPCLLLVP